MLCRVLPPGGPACPPALSRLTRCWRQPPSGLFSAEMYESFQGLKNKENMFFSLKQKQKNHFSVFFFLIPKLFGGGPQEQWALIP